MKRSAVASAAILAVAFFLTSSGLQAQSNDEINAAVQFNFSNPGARSLALGGAFIGLADDATAAYTNPAGLTNLSRPEVSVEGRSWKYTHSFTDRGRAFGELQPGEEPLQEGQSSDTLRGLSFFSVVYPRKDGAIAFYRHELANFRANVSTHGPTFGDFAIFPTQSRMNLDVINYGISGAYRIGGSLSLGVGFSYYDFSLDSRTQRFIQDDPPIIGTQTQKGDSSSFGVNLGLLWAVTPNWNVGASFRLGPKFDVTATSNRSYSASFHVPDVLGFGTAFKPTDKSTVTIDFVRVKYSNLTQNVSDIFASGTAQKLRADDADEFHFGFEHVFVKNQHPLSLRLGAWYDPDHKIRFDGFPANDDEATDAILFRPGANEWHYSAGLGFVIGEKFQIDAAADLSERIDTYSLSSVFRF